MIQWLQKKYKVKYEDIPPKKRLELLRQQVLPFRKKYHKEDKEMEVSSESDSEIDEEDQKRINEEMHKRQQKKKNAYKCKRRSIWYSQRKKTFLVKSNSKN